MKEIPSTISGKGQVTVPAEVRRLLGVGTKEKVAFVSDLRRGAFDLQCLISQTSPRSLARLESPWPGHKYAELLAKII